MYKLRGEKTPLKGGARGQSGVAFARPAMGATLGTSGRQNPPQKVTGLHEVFPVQHEHVDDGVEDFDLLFREGGPD